jgi:hypothetical protein
MANGVLQDELDAANKQVVDLTEQLAERPPAPVSATMDGLEAKPE